MLTILNASGCLVLTALVVMQWNRERARDATLARIKSELFTSEKQVVTATKHSGDLERDIAALKESMEAMRVAAEDSARVAAEKESLTNGLQSEVATARAQVQSWQDAIAVRDAKLLELTSHLNATRQRLDAAISKLK